MKQLKSLFETITGKTVILIGDVFLNETVHGEMAGLSDLSPIPVVQKHGKTVVPGAAGYAAILMRRMGMNVKFVSVIGDDPSGHEILKILEREGIDVQGVLIDPDFTTNNYTRINVAGSRYNEREILRMSTAEPLPLSEEKYEKIFGYVEQSISAADAVVFIDSDKSVIRRSLVEAVQKIARKNKTLLVGDSKKHTHYFKKFTAVTPNLHEAWNVFHGKKDNFDKLGKQLRSYLKCEMVFITLGGEGISVFADNHDSIHVPATPCLFTDKTGAGEAVVTAVTAGLLAGWQPVSVAEFANKLAALAVCHKGYPKIGQKDVLDAQIRSSMRMQAEKHVNIDQLRDIVTQEKVSGRKIIWTNGCYDILHAGHVIYLEKAKSLGDVLIVGLNSDASVQKNKGPLRPVIDENQRAKLISALSCVDYVVVFDDVSPLNMINELRPDIYVKGGDYDIDTINQEERRLVESYGGDIALLPGVEGMSTTEMINRIIKAYGDKPESES
ncbi:D-glycero-beta-D-manno-heptose 1-phosphate adenylyltransferase [candidate division KSB1 bacterium]|nr:D-glycero-beta-D-manno-heptose 1-phosphate adenylyltransferase [candidate division KSB1 bacterium]